MKLLPILLATTLSATPAFAAKGGEGGNTNCNGQGNPNSPCQVQTPPGNGGGGSGGNGGNGGNGGSGGQGGRGGDGGSAVSENSNDNRNTNNNTNTSNNTNRNENNANSESSSTSRSSSDNRVDVSNDTNVRNTVRSDSRATGGRSDASARATGGSSTSSIVNRNTSYDERETPVAPLLGTSDSAQMEGVTVPLPTLGISGFYTQGDSYGYRDDIGITLGFRTPLGGGAFRDAALRREKFRVVQEAIFLRDKGVLTYDAFPQHYIALYGAAPSPTDRPATK